MIFGLDVGTNDEEVYNCFVFIKFPKRKVSRLISSEKAAMYGQIKEYLKNPNMKAVSSLNSIHF